MVYYYQVPRAGTVETFIKITLLFFMIWTWIVSSLAIFITAYILPRVQISFGSALITSIVIGLLNMFVKPILVFLSFPITIITLGLFTLVINAIIVLLAGKIVPGFKIEGFWQAFVFAIVLAIIQAVLFAVIG